MSLQLPEGWQYRPTVFAKPPCPTCGHRQDHEPGELRSSWGAIWSMTGIRSLASERRMVERIVEAHGHL